MRQHQAADGRAEGRCADHGDADHTHDAAHALRSGGLAGLIGFGLGLRYLPLGPGTPLHRLDIAGAVLAGGGVAAVVYGLSGLGEGSGSVTAVSFWLPTVLGVVALAGFIARAVRGTRPPVVAAAGIG